MGNRPKGEDFDYRPYNWTIEKPIIGVNFYQLDVGVDETMISVHDFSADAADTTNLDINRKLIVIQNPDAELIVNFGARSGAVFGRIEAASSVVLPWGPDLDLILSCSGGAVTGVVVIQMA